MIGRLTVRRLETPQGQARVHLHPARDPAGALLLGHGAGGGVDAPDLIAATNAGLAEGFSVAVVEQPYRVAGKRSQPAATTIDAAWSAVLAQLREGALRGLPLIVGGRSAGARVACRTAAENAAVAVLCLAFPLRPPARKGKPRSPSRLGELDALAVPTLVVQGDRDRFGIPPAGKLRTVVEVPGDHSLRKDPEAVAAAVRGWLPGALAQGERSTAADPTPS
jgi:predicted alpha/beta-hydrolase family hydrolase